MMSYVLIHRMPLEDEPDLIVEVRSFSGEAEAIASASEIVEREQSKTLAFNTWYEKSTELRSRLFDEYVRAHLYKPSVREARVRLDERINQELGPCPSIGELPHVEIYKCEGIVPGTKIWPLNEDKRL